MKDYLLVRWKKRWPILPGMIIVGFFAHLTYPERNKIGATIVFVTMFVLFVILFPFRWGGENW